MKNIPLRIGVSGKRSLSSPEETGRRISNEIRSILDKEKATTFIALSSIAIGADTIFAQVATTEFNATLEVVLPFDAELYALDFKTGNDKTAYHELLKTQKKPLVPKTQGVNTEEDKKNAYLTAGKYIADHCDYLVVVWDGQKPKGKGGTPEILGYADGQREEDRIIIIMDEPVEKDPILANLKILKENADVRAIAKGNDYKNVWSWSILLGLIAAICFGIGISYKYSEAVELLLSILEVVLVTVVFLTVLWARHNEIHSSYLDARINAEILRITEVYYHAGVPLNIIDAKAVDTIEIINKMNEHNKSMYQSPYYKRYAIKQIIKNQLDYHHRRICRIGNTPDYLNRTKIFVAVIFWINLILHSISLGTVYWECKWQLLYPEGIACFLGVSLPAFYAAIESILFFEQWEVFKEQSEHMIRSLKKKEEMAKMGNDDKMIDLLESLSREMLADNENWQDVLKDKLFSYRI